MKASDASGTGLGGRVLKEDAERAVKNRKAASKTASKPAAKPVAGSRDEEIVPMTRMRKTIAKRLVEAQQNAALLTTVNEADMTSVMDLRTRFKQKYQDQYGIKLGFMSFFVKAVIEGLKAYPAMNAEIRGDDIVYKNYYDIGVAVGGGKGLVVPILRNAESMSFAEVELAIADLGQRAKAGRIMPDDLTGGTFSITNGGVYGSLLSTPILNPPQSGILGMHNIVERPMGVDGQVVLRPMMYLAVTYDHRIVDGREAVGFLVRIKECIENPERILLEV
jgi:2-oxoglutarate dehydrogenase E2 component (dihydrolipoamide succinyltransferase)